MPKNDTDHIPGGAWVQLTNADVTAITFANVGTNVVRVTATVGAIAPTSIRGSIPYPPGWGECRDLSEIWKGVPGANRVWAYAGQPTDVFVSHA